MSSDSYNLLAQSGEVHVPQCDQEAQEGNIFQGERCVEQFRRYLTSYIG